MTNTPDTSPEAVERLAQMLETDASDQHTQPCEMTGLMPEDEYEAAATLRALSAALDVERASHTATITDWQADLARAEAAEAERDALKAELAEAKMLLSHMVNHAEWLEKNEYFFWEATDKARAFLARHQKETDT